ncbi:ABC1 kinase family protein [Candidatus Protochlamydia phocaeensis]|uniref:ABC1 kinase family protein n=1 Tax=Candidatus Protochlamydia phocaeensis TaxID=1414722 RepID=UPI000AF0C22C|nr:AarF/UbiB family protein [Candidatus Protochlamydia phocaeensis]
MTNLQLKHIKRYKDFAWLLVKYGRSDLLKEVRAELPQLEEGRTETAGMPKPEELAKDLQKMGPTFVKLGQLLSTQSDIFPDAYIEALSKLQDKAEPFSYEEVEKIFKEELGVRIQDIFKDFEKEPLAAGSLAQVHKAVLPSDRIVAVKVQRPHIQAGIIEDLDVLEEIATFLEKQTTWGKRYNLVDKVIQLRTTLLNELDYRKEAINQISFKRNLKEFRRILIPSPVEDYTTSRILTMDFISGQKITDISPLIKMEIDGERLAEDLFEAYLKQIIIDGLVHIDPHPGNIYLSQDNRLVILDLGMVARIAPQLQTGLLKLLLAVSEGQGEEVADIIIRLGQKTDEFDYHVFREHISNLVAQYQDLNLAQMAIGQVLIKISGASAETGVKLPPAFNLLGKALLNLDRVGKALAPHFSPNESIRENATALLTERMRRNFSAGVFFRTFIEATEFVQHLPAKMNNILDILSKNELKLDVDAFNERRLMIGFEKVANRITLGLVLAALIIGAALLMRIETNFTIWGYPGLAILLFLAAALGGLALIINILMSDEKKEPK